MSDALAVRASSGVWLAAMTVTVVLAWRRLLSVPQAWVASVGSYLLFCPHLTSTEWFHMFAVAALVWSAPHTRWRASVGVSVVALALGPYLAPMFPWMSGVRWLLTVFIAAGTGTALATLRAAPPPSS